MRLAPTGMLMRYLLPLGHTLYVLGWTTVVPREERQPLAARTIKTQTINALITGSNRQNSFLFQEGVLSSPKGL